MKTITEAYLSIYNEIHSNVPFEEPEDNHIYSLEHIKEECYRIIDMIETGSAEGNEVIAKVKELYAHATGQHTQSSSPKVNLGKHANRWNYKAPKEEEPPADETEA